MPMTCSAASTMAIVQLGRGSEFVVRYISEFYLSNYRLTAEIKDNVQVYNIPKFDGYHHRTQPPVLQEQYVYHRMTYASKAG